MLLDHESTPLEMPKETCQRGLHFFLFLPTHIPYLTRQLHTQECSSQSSSCPPTRIPYSKATPPVKDSGMHCIRLRDRQAAFTAIPEAACLTRGISHLATWRDPSPSPCAWQHGAETSQWTNTTKGLPLSLWLWPKQGACPSAYGPCSTTTERTPSQGTSAVQLSNELTGK